MSSTATENEHSNTTAPTMTEVIKFVFKDAGEPDDSHWILMEHGTFYTFRKSEHPEATKASLSAKVLDMCDKAILVTYQDNDCVTVYPYREWGWPVYVVLSTLGAKIGWIIVGATPQWAETDEQLAACGYLGRTRYEMDTEQHQIKITSFD